MKTRATLLFAGVIAASCITAAGAAGEVTAISTREMGQSVFVNQTAVTPTGYNIADNNYFRLRDIASLVGFGVEWDEKSWTVEISSERTSGSTADIRDQSVPKAAAKVSSQRFALDGYYIRMKAYQIGGENYVRLRDIASYINFGVEYDAETKRISIYPDRFYDEESPEEPSGSEISGAVSEETLRRWELEMVAKINEERQKVGVAPLEMDEKLMEWAQEWAEHLTAEFRHSTIDEERAFALQRGWEEDDIYSQENITGAGRITGIGYDPLTLSMNNFMSSEGHRNTLLNAFWTRVGVGFAQAEDGNIFCCQEFGF